MKNAENKFRQIKLKNKRPIYYSILLIILLGLNSCTEDVWIIERPQPSDAYLALTWSEDEPEYIDAGTAAIPEVFYWNDYYHVHPGFYTLYYDGIYNDGYDYVDYAWEVDYEIYTNNGVYSDDNYFTVDLNPYGPYVYEDYKSTTANISFKVLEKNESKIVILKEMKEYSLKITYKKVERRIKQ